MYSINFVLKIIVMRTVKEILNAKPKPFNMIKPTTLVIDALNLMKSLDLSYLIVMNEGQYKGIFCEKDYRTKVVLEGHASNNTKVTEVMTVDLPWVSLEDTAEYCMNLMNAARSRYLLVFDEDHKFAGIITINDLLREVIANKEFVFDEDETGKIM
jgi:CBS domain-containing protein